jgi:hypothetical protein
MELGAGHASGAHHEPGNEMPPLVFRAPEHERGTDRKQRSERLLEAALAPQREAR